MKRLLVIVPLALAAACSGEVSRLESGLSKGDYIERSEVICAKANGDVKALAFPTSLAAIEEYVTKVVGIADTATKDLTALDAPLSDEAELKTKVLTPLQAQVVEGKAYLEKIKAAVAAKDQTRIGELISEPPTTTKADLTWMKDYGFKECVEAAKTDQ